jgi:hypothetical protein
MRNLLLLFLLVISLSGFYSKTWSQKDNNDTLFKEIKMPVDNATKLITYSNVINVDAKKDSLYKKGLKWFNTYYKNPKGVLKIQNPDEGKISGKPQFRILNPPDKNGTTSMGGIIYYTITTLYKDGKCRYEITDINLEQTAKYPVEKWLEKDSKSFKPVYNYFLRQVDDNIKQTIKNYENFMKLSNAAKNDAW